MQKSVAILAVFCALVFAARVEAFSVYLERIVIGTTKEAGGVPEVLVLCDVGEAHVLINLADVNEINVVYIADPPVYIDKHLGLHEVHHCIIYESDSFSRDYDREDNDDDPYGYFTVSRSDFVNGTTVIKYLPGEIAILLGCEHC